MTEETKDVLRIGKVRIALLSNELLPEPEGRLAKSVFGGLVNVNIEPSMASIHHRLASDARNRRL